MDYPAHSRIACPICDAQVRTEAYGLVRKHGPKDDPCPASRARSETQALEWAAAWHVRAADDAD